MLQPGPCSLWFMPPLPLPPLGAPLGRASSPLTLEAVEQLIQAWKQPSLQQHFHAASRKCMTPEQVEQQHAEEQRQHMERRSGGGERRP